MEEYNAGMGYLLAMSWEVNGERGRGEVLWLLKYIICVFLTADKRKLTQIFR